MTIPAKETTKDKEASAEAEIEVASHTVGEDDEQQQRQQEEEPPSQVQPQTEELMQQFNQHEQAQPEQDEKLQYQNHQRHGIVSNTEAGDPKQEKAANSLNRYKEGTALSDEKPSDAITSPASTTSARKAFSLPKAVYCPITHEIMKDPVVHPDGESYEKSAITEKDPDVTCYPNRALKAYIEKEYDRLKNCSEQREGSSLRSTWDQLLETAALPFRDYYPLPDSFYCPITFDLIYEPVIDKDGYTYEQAALINWIKVNFDSPVTRQPLSSEDLYKNKAMLRVMLELTDCEEENMHPPLLKWRQELNTRHHAESPLEFEMVTVTQVQSSFSGDEEQNPYQIAHYPTTREEINAVRRRNSQVVIASVFLATVFSLVLYVFSPRYFLFLMVFGSIFYCIKIAQARRRAFEQA